MLKETDDPLIIKGQGSRVKGCLVARNQWECLKYRVLRIGYRVQIPGSILRTRYSIHLGLLPPSRFHCNYGDVVVLGGPAGEIGDRLVHGVHNLGRGTALKA